MAGRGGHKLRQGLMAEGGQGWGSVLADEWSRMGSFREGACWQAGKGSPGFQGRQEGGGGGSQTVGCCGMKSSRAMKINTVTVRWDLKFDGIKAGASIYREHEDVLVA